VSFFRSQNGIGSLLPVSVQGCQTACAMAGATCDAVSYNPTLQACYLKAGTSAANCQARILPSENPRLGPSSRSCGKHRVRRSLSPLLRKLKFTRQKVFQEADPAVKRTAMGLGPKP